MITALWTAATGMNAQQSNVDVISNNLANVNTNGFKKSTVNFQDLVYNIIRQPGSPNAQGAQIPVGVEIGHGVKVSDTQKIFTEGNIQPTENPLDLAIEGEGFLQIQRPDGTIAYTRDGSFKMDSNGDLVTADGYRLQPNINIPPNATDITITSDGTVNVVLDGDTQNTQPQGQIQLVRFANPAGLNSMGKNLFAQTAASGQAQAGAPAQDGYGSILQGFLEKSNVKVVEEMVNLIAAQRAYDTNSKAIQAADEMLNTANQLRR